MKRRAWNSTLPARSAPMKRTGFKPALTPPGAGVSGHPMDDPALVDTSGSDPANWHRGAARKAGLKRTGFAVPKVGRQERRALARRSKTSPSDFSKPTRALVRARSGGTCEAAGCHQRATEMHHRKLKSRRGHTPGMELAGNAAHLCGGHHRHVHANPTAARRAGLIVRSHEDPLQVPVATADGWVLLGNDGTATPVEAAA